MRALAAVMAAGVAMAVTAPAVAAPTVAQLQRQVKAEKARATKYQRALTREKVRTFSLRTDVNELRSLVRSMNADLTQTTEERDALRTAFNATSGQLATVAGERDAAAAQAAAARGGVEGAIATMTVNEAWGLLDDIYRRFPTSGLTWSASVFSSGSYRSYSFTYSP